MALRRGVEWAAGPRSTGGTQWATRWQIPTSRTDDCSSDSTGCDRRPGLAVFQQILRLLFHRGGGADRGADADGVRPSGSARPHGDRRRRGASPNSASMAARTSSTTASGRSRGLVVIGFFEFTFMRVREDVEQSPRCSTSTCTATTRSPAQCSRAAPRSGGRSCGRSRCRRIRRSRCSDWELATHTSSPRPTRSPSRECPCRTHANLIGEGCGRPTRTCLTFGGAARAWSDPGIAEEISNVTRRLLATAKAAGLAHNVKHGISYMCNCCGCCCGMMQAIRHHRGDVGAAGSDRPATCRGCKKCYRRCPAISIVDSKGRARTGPSSTRRSAWVAGLLRGLPMGRTLDSPARPGCSPRRTRSTGWSRRSSAGSGGDLLVDTLTGAGPHALSRALGILVASEPATARRAVEPLNSVFLRGALAAVHATARVAGPAAHLAPGARTDRPAQQRGAPSSRRCHVDGYSLVAALYDRVIEPVERPGPRRGPPGAGSARISWAARPTRIGPRPGGQGAPTPPG